MRPQKARPCVFTIFFPWHGQLFSACSLGLRLDPTGDGSVSYTDLNRNEILNWSSLHSSAHVSSRSGRSHFVQAHCFFKFCWPCFPLIFLYAAYPCLDHDAPFCCWRFWPQEGYKLCEKRHNNSYLSLRTLAVQYRPLLKLICCEICPLFIAKLIPDQRNMINDSHWNWNGYYRAIIGFNIRTWLVDQSVIGLRPITYTDPNDGHCVNTWPWGSTVTYILFCM